MKSPERIDFRQRETTVQGSVMEEITRVPPAARLVRLS
jgi:hypothetical protein